MAMKKIQSDKTDNNLFDIEFSKLSIKQRTAFVQQMHMHDQRMFKCALYFPVTQQQIHRPIQELISSNQRKELGGLSNVVKGMRNDDLSEFILTSKTNADREKKCIDSPIEVVRSQLMLALNFTWNLCDTSMLCESNEERFKYLQKAEEHIEPIIFSEKIRSEIMSNIGIMMNKKNKFVRAFNRSLYSITGRKLQNAGNLFLLGDSEDFFEQYYRFNSEELSALFSRALDMCNVQVQELLEACGFSHMNDLLIHGPIMKLMFDNYDRLKVHRDKIVVDNVGYVQKVVYDMMGRNPHELNEASQDCLLALTSNVFSYNPMYSYTTFVKFNCDHKIKEAIRLKGVIAIPQRTLNDKALIIESGKDENGVWHLDICRKNLPSRFNYTDGEILDIMASRVQAFSIDQSDDDDDRSGAVGFKETLVSIESFNGNEEMIEEANISNSFLEFFDYTKRKDPKYYAQIMQYFGNMTRAQYASKRNSEISRYQKEKMKKNIYEDYQEFIRETQI